MSKYTVEYLESALEDIRSVGFREQKAIQAKIEWLALFGDEISHQALEGKRFRRKFKLRIGNYRLFIH